METLISLTFEGKLNCISNSYWFANEFKYGNTDSYNMTIAIDDII